MTRRARRTGIAILLAVALVYVARGDEDLDRRGPDAPASASGEIRPADLPPPPDARQARVVRVVDGDTVVLTGVGKSRLIGVDTPEVYGRAECYGNEASSFAKRVLRSGSPVSYTLGREPRDRYRRALVYLWLADGRSFNAMLVAAGYAVPLTIPPNDDHARQFLRLSRAARARSRGLWASAACAGRA
jgi:endonuclease YncB( thermonuclease family)